MTDNFFTDNLDLQYHLDRWTWRKSSRFSRMATATITEYPGAPRNYADAKDNYRLILEVLGDICANQIAPRAAEADEEGVHIEDGQVTYAAAIAGRAGVSCARPS